MALRTFLLASSAGVLLFLVPLPQEGVWKIPVGILADGLTDLFRPVLPAIAALLAVMSAVLTLAWRFPALRQRFDGPVCERLFRPTAVWLILRILGAATAVVLLFELGPAWLQAEAVGGVVLGQLAPVIIMIFLVAGLALPLLTDFGLMEFTGVLAQPVFRPLFTVPGRAAVDAVASWMGSSPVGVLITLRQYEGGFYDTREAAVIATNFSIVSTAFCYAVASLLDVAHLFPGFYATVTVAGIVCAIVLPRIPPLSRKPARYASVPGGASPDAAAPPEVQQEGIPARALRLAVQRAAASPPLAVVFRNAAVNVLDIWFGLLPGVLFIGTVSLAVAEYTPLFQWAGTPFYWLLSALRIPEAAAAAPAMVIGFADMFLPAVIGQSIEAQITRFLVGVISVVQLIYMSELGVLILRSKLPLNALELALIFLLRTLVALPVAVAGARWFAG